MTPRAACGPLLWALLLAAAPPGELRAQPRDPIPAGARAAPSSDRSVERRPAIRDTQPEPARWPRGARGALIGGVVGLAFGVAAIRGLCETQCDARAENGRVLLVTTAGGAVAGFLVERLLTSGRLGGRVFASARRIGASGSGPTP